MTVTIEWVGLACFRVWREGGPVIVTDPYTLQEVGLPEDGRTVDGDIVISSSLEDRAHGNPKLVRGSPRVIDALEVNVQGSGAEVDGSPVITVGAAESADHVDAHGRFEAPKDNAVYALKVGDLWILHLGDLGYGLTAEELAPLVGRCDVLLAIVGQTNTIPLEDLDFLIAHLQPKWIVPMHYRLPPISGPLRPLDEFLVHRPQDPLIYPRSSAVTLPLEIPGAKYPAIIVLEPSGYQPT